MEEFNAECQEKIENVKQSVEIKMNTLKQQVNNAQWRRLACVLFCIPVYLCY